MRRVLVPTVLAFVLFACATQPVSTPQPEAVTVFTNAKIFTSDRANLWAEAIAVQGERIIAVGASSDVLAAAQQRSTVIDVHNLEGRVVVPGFNDAHFHGGRYVDYVEVELPASDPETSEVIGKLREAASLQPPGTWLRARVSGHVMLDPAVDRPLLDDVSTAHPIFITNRSGHGTIMNSRALEIIGFDEATTPPMGGELGRTHDGALNGRLVAYANREAMQRVADLVPNAMRVASYAQAARMLLARGMTSVQDFANTRPAPEVTSAVAAAAVPLRWRVIRYPMTTRTSFGAEADIGPLPRGSHPGVKWALDGTPIERGAAMRVPYRDDSATYGRMNFTDDIVEQMLIAADARGEQPMFHAVGDAAIEQVLRALDATGGAARWKGKRVRIEHADMITIDQIVRFRDLGGVLVQNPAHLATPEMKRERFSERADPVQPLKSILSRQAPLALGSDGPSNPFLNLMFAATHPTTPAEALTREEAVIAYTYGSAYAEFAEDEKGTLTAGKLADLAVLDADIFTVPPDQLPRVKSIVTMIGGKVVGP